jgi:hypothetical protein
MRLMSQKIFASLCASLALAACDDAKPAATASDTSTATDSASGGGSDTTSGADAGGSDTGAGETDTASGGESDTGGGEDDVVTPVTCDREGFTSDESFLDTGDGYDAFGLSSATQTLIVEFYDVGDGSPLEGVGTYPVGTNPGDDNYETCSTCVLIAADCTEEGCAKTFFATEGSIEVTAFDRDAKTVTARLLNARFVEVTIDGDTYASTPVADGEGWCISEAAIAAAPECTTNAACTDPTKPVCNTTDLVCVECADDSACSDPTKPFCATDEGVCVACTNDFQCTAAAPVCQASEDGVVGCGVIDACTGDDAGENGDDGPLGAGPITLGETKAAKICGGREAASIGEADYYSFDMAAAGKLNVTLTWGNESDLDLYVVDTEGQIVDRSARTTGNPEVVTFAELPDAQLPAGRFYIVVMSYDGNPTDAIDYTLKIEQPAN